MDVRAVLRVERWMVYIFKGLTYLHTMYGMWVFNPDHTCWRHNQRMASQHRPHHRHKGKEELMKPEEIISKTIRAIRKENDNLRIDNVVLKDLALKTHTHEVKADEIEYTLGELRVEFVI